MNTPDPNLYARGERFDRWVYDFRCPACGSCGELGVPKAAKWINCPEECGARFVQWQPPVFGTEPGPCRGFALRCINEQEARLGIALARATLRGHLNGRRG